MSAVNKAILIGRVGKEPETRFTSSGQAVANFSVATDETFKDRSGEKQKKTERHNIVVWGKSVEAFIQPYLHKGDLVYLEGKLQTRKWENKRDGTTKYTTEINVTDIKILTSAGGAQQESAKPQTRRTTRPQAAPAPAAGFDSSEIPDEDIPF